MTHVVAIEHIGVEALLEQAFFNRMRQRRFARARIAGKPEQAAFVVVFLLPASSSYGGVVPDNVAASTTHYSSLMHCLERPYDGVAIAIFLPYLVYLRTVSHSSYSNLPLF